jgi:hypothetical protein
MVDTSISLHKYLCLTANLFVYLLLSLQTNCSLGYFERSARRSERLLDGGGQLESVLRGPGVVVAGVRVDLLSWKPLFFCLLLCYMKGIRNQNDP